MKHYDLLFCILRLSLLEQYFNVWHNGSQVSLAVYFLIFNFSLTVFIFLMSYVFVQSMGLEPDLQE